MAWEQEAGTVIPGSGLSSALSYLQSVLLLSLALVVSTVNQRGMWAPITGSRAHPLPSQTLEHRATARQGERRGTPHTLGVLRGNSQILLGSSSETFHR